MKKKYNLVFFSYIKKFELVFLFKKKYKFVFLYFFLYFFCIFFADKNTFFYFFANKIHFYIFFYKKNTKMFFPYVFQLQPLVLKTLKKLFFKFVFLKHFFSPLIIYKMMNDCQNSIESKNMEQFLIVQSLHYMLLIY